MKTIAKWILGSIFILVAAFVALFIATRGDYPVAALVTRDSALPSHKIENIHLHMQIAEGPAGAQTIVVLHGGAGADFRSLLGLSALSQTHNVVFYDQRGAGLSERVSADHLTLEGYLAELNAIIDFASPDKPVVLIGHSWGAMLLSAYLGEFPGRVDRAVLIEPGFLDSEGHANWTERSKEFMSGAAYFKQAVLNGFRAAHVDGPDAAARDDFLIGRMAHVFADHPDNPYHCGDGYDAPAWRFGSLASSIWRDMPEADIDRFTKGAEFEGPVLLLAGGCNDWLGAPLQSRHAAMFANAELATIPEAGHDVVWDNPEATLNIIKRFLAAKSESG